MQNFRGLPVVSAALVNLSLTRGERWYAVQSLFRREPGAQLQLNRQGFRTFLPLMTKTVRHARKLKTLRAALFPGYLFVILDLEHDPWRSVNGTFGVSHLIMANDLPLPVPSGVVETLIDYADERNVCRFDRDLKQGQSVRVTFGPIAEALGEIVSLDDKGRVRVLLEVMGGKVMTTLDRTSVTAV